MACISLFYYTDLQSNALSAYAKYIQKIERVVNHLSSTDPDKIRIKNILSEVKSMNNLSNQKLSQVDGINRNRRLGDNEQDDKKVKYL